MMFNKSNFLLWSKSWIFSIITPVPELRVQNVQMKCIYLKWHFL